MNGIGMAFSSLREFLALLEQRSDLVRVDVPVTPELEITEIQRRLIAEDGPAVLFTRPVRAGTDGSAYAMPLLANLFGSVRRVAAGMNRSPDELREVGRMLAFLRQPDPPRSLTDALSLIPLARTVMSMRPRLVGNPPCQDVVYLGDDVDLGLLPIQTCWPDEPAPVLTWPLVITRGPGDARQDDTNLGIYRMQLVDRRTTLMRWLASRGGALHFQRWRAERAEPFPVAVAIGADPATMLAAVTPLPDTVSEYHFAGLLRGKRVDLTNCLTVPLQVPAQAEIVLEGHVSLQEESEEGPYGDHTGYYNAAEPFPVFRLSAMTMRRDAIYLSTFTGRPPDEPSILAEALNELFIPILQQQFPEIVDFWLPPEACSYRMAVVSIRKAYPGHAKRIMMAIWSYLRQFALTKFIIVVDHDVDIRNWQDIIWALSTRVDPGRDLLVIEGTMIDYLDFASPESSLGGKLGIDATNKWPPETKRSWGKPLAMSEEILAKVSARWQEYGFTRNR